jgi:hypothetical protein
MSPLRRSCWSARAASGLAKADAEFIAQHKLFDEIKEDVED